MARADQIRVRRTRYAAKAPELAECVRGTVVTRYSRCGKPNCGCATDDSRRHGPYHYLLVTTGRGKTKTQFIPPHMLADVKRWSANYTRLKQVIEQVTEASCLLLDAERERGAAKR